MTIASVAPFQAIAISRIAHDLAEQGRSVIHMEFGQPSTGAPAAAVAEAHRVLDAEAMGYWESNALKDRIARYYGQGHGVAVDREQVILTCGASPAFVLALSCLFAPGARVEARQRTDLRIVHFACLAQTSFLAVEEKERNGTILGFSWPMVEALTCGAPPPEIASNPGRLQMWLELREKQFWLFAGGGVDDIFEVKGCGAHRFFNCLDKGPERRGAAKHPCFDVGSVDPLTATGPVPMSMKVGGR